MSTSATDLTPETLLAAKDTSYWLKSALQSALERGPADALNDALALAGALEERLRHELGLAASNGPKSPMSPSHQEREPMITADSARPSQRSIGNQNVVELR